jgi:chaperonin GroES
MSNGQTPAMPGGAQAPGINQDTSQAYASPQQYTPNPMDAPQASNGMYSPGMGPEGTETTPQDTQTPIRKLLESANIAKSLDEDKLNEIGATCKKGFDQDVESRRDWERNIDDWTKLAIQAKEQKSYPWPHASNIKYPLLSTAAMQFAARAYPSLVPSDGQVVKSKVIGKDPDGEKQRRAEHTSIYVSYQLMEEMDNWEEDMDKLLIMLPVVGTMFKKTYWDGLTEKNCSKLVMPKNLVVNYWARDLDHVERISEIIEMSQRLFKERQNADLFLDIDLGLPQMQEHAMNQPAQDATTPYNLVEQHTFLDLDDDGYEEPYIVTFQKESGKVLRITARFDELGLKTGDDDEVVRIEPIQYYTKFGFIPNPDGSFYDIGFGVLLGPINDSVNTLINQLVDAGSLNNLQSGFIGKGLRLKMGESRFQPGEWKAVNATADDLKKQILPLPTKEPSEVLFKLMGALITSGKELASVAEIFVGKMPGQNTPATTTMATIEQGMKVFTAVYKRTYRSLAKEYKKLYRLNEVYLNPETYVDILDANVNPDDFKSIGYSICPGADPSAISQTEKLLKAQGLAEMLPMGILDPVKVVQRILEAQEQPNWQELLHQEVQQTGQPPQQPDPKAQELQMKMQAEQQKSGMKQQELEFKSQLDQRDQQFKQAMADQSAAHEHKFKAMEMAMQMQVQEHDIRSKMLTNRQQMVQADQQHAQKVVHTEQAHHQKMQHAAKAAAAKPARKK